MKKLLLFATALLTAFAVNATVKNISPTTPEAADNLRLALYYATDGDTIVLADGTYVESNSNYIALDKNIVVMAAEGASPVLQPQVPITVSKGAKAELIGIKIDASKLTEKATWYEHIIYAADTEEGNSLTMTDCELYNFTLNKSAIYCSSANKMAELKINNCYFYNNTKSCIFFEGDGVAALTIKNSTFANIATDASGYYAGVIDPRGTTTKVVVDHCTFYNCQTMNTDYGAIKVKNSTDAAVSNSIFMMPESYSDGRAIYNKGGTINNCITFNYSKDSNTGLHSGPTITACSQVDPLFVGATNGDYTLGEGSPALAAGTDGSNLGDPRWWPAVKVEKKSLKEFYAAADKENAVVLNDLTVTYIYEYGNNIFAVDAEGTGACIYYKGTSHIAAADVQVGSVISGLEAKYDIYNSMPEVIPTAKPEAITAGEAPAPQLFTEAPTIDDACKLIKVEQAAVTKKGNNYYIFSTVQLYDKFKIDGYGVEENKQYDFVGIVIPYAKSGDPIIELCPTILPENGTSTAVDNLHKTDKAVKVIENGQIFILHNGKTYNIFGDIVTR